MKSKLKKILDFWYSGSGSQAPTVQASNLVASNFRDGAGTITVTPGNGSERMLVMRAVIPINANPTNGVTYTANSVFGTGDYVGSGEVMSIDQVATPITSGNEVIAKGSGSSFNVTGLTIGVVYYVRVYEMNGTAYNTTDNAISATCEASPLGDTNLKFLFDPSNTQTLWTRNNNSEAQLEHSLLNGDVVGSVYDISPRSMFFGPASDARRPLLGSDGTRNSFVTFDGTDDNFPITNSTSAFNFVHKTNPTWSLAAWVKMDQDGTNRQIIGNNDAGTARVGFSIIRNSINTISISVQYGVGGQNMVSFATTYTLNVAAGWKLIVINVNGSGTGKGSITIADASSVITAETFNVGVTGTNNNASNACFIGSNFTPANYFRGSIGYLELRDRLITADEITILRAYNPARRSVNFRRLHYFIDFNDSTTIFQNLAGTTPITDGAEIQRVNSKTDSDLNRYWQYASVAGEATAGKPVWEQALVNGLSVGEWNGDTVDAVYDNLAFVSPPERGGARIEFIIAKNRRAGSGSHLLSNGPGYFVWTGEDYGQNDDLNNGHGYSIVHTGDDGPLAPIPRIPEDWNAMMNRKDAEKLETLTEDLYKGTANNQNNGNDSGWTNIGYSWKTGGLGPPWHMDGFWGVYKSFRGYATDREGIDLLRQLMDAYPYNNAW